MEAARIAVLMTSHNRREKTLTALAALRRQRGLPPGTALSVHLVDAGSSDGTARAVAERFPDVDVTTVGTDVFWGEGMRLAGHSSDRPDLPPCTHRLWLNDDVTLDDDAVAELLATADRLPAPAVVVGAVRASDGSRTTYSGRRRTRPRWHPRSHDFALVEPTGRPEPCDTFNGNVVLVPRAAYDRLGDIDRRFRHSMGDYDYGLRARRAGIPVHVTPRHVGVCDTNPPGTGSREPGIGVREALRRVTSRRELPLAAWWSYCNRHLWPWAPVWMVSPYLLTAARALTGGHDRAER
ncbi:glycosyltransferase family 2 protein [Streptomyces jeddahensis]|uniref:N-acetylglucosaminyl-diphospho-decaprenol L-rhamnosyltransferase n=1 Tax=Streptomyces jeddahensis TaxID=1716141 RepID=A0A177HGV9_9ACTN|nr:glycosyltransferase family 2 protein [Streptomyces jeddahensis]OAH09607.1 N-acetylglucosaminyl-diphospho-decaprenol L-rhamnosyltransferase [Streptomyces jeddahensis]